MVPSLSDLTSWVTSLDKSRGVDFQPSDLLTLVNEIAADLFEGFRFALKLLDYNSEAYAEMRSLSKGFFKKIDLEHSRIRAEHREVLFVQGGYRVVTLVFNEMIFMVFSKKWGLLLNRGADKKLYNGVRVSRITHNVGDLAVGVQKKCDETATEEYTYQTKVTEIHEFAKVYFMSYFFKPKDEFPRQLTLMTFYTKFDLLEQIYRNILTDPQKLAIAKRIAMGLSKFHNLGYSHNDMKTANILLDGHFNAFITDLGFASKKDAPYRGIKGTFGYLPTEICPASLSKVQRVLEKKIYLEENNEILSELEAKSEQNIKNIRDVMFNLVLENEIILIKNDMCALGYIYEEMFGRGFHPVIDQLIDELTHTDPNSRPSADDVVARISNL